MPAFTVCFLSDYQPGASTVCSVYVTILAVVVNGPYKYLAPVSIATLDQNLESMDQLHGRIPAEALRTAIARFNEAMSRRYSPDHSRLCDGG